MLSLTPSTAPDPLLSWQVASLLPLLIAAILLNISRIFELFTLRVAAYLAVFYNSPWENHVHLAPFQRILHWRPSYNKTLAMLYFRIAVASTVTLIIKYPCSRFLFHTILFAFFLWFVYLGRAC